MFILLKRVWNLNLQSYEDDHQKQLQIFDLFDVTINISLLGW